MLPIGPAARMLLGLIRLADATLSSGSVANARAATEEIRRRQRLLQLASEPGIDISDLSRSA
jgi:hypothetical protein